MPTYQYSCTGGHDLEVVQKFSDPSLTDCPECGGSLKKVFNAVGVVFKGSGFYRTDSRGTSNSVTAGESKSTEKAGGDSAPAADTKKSDSSSTTSSSGSGSSSGTSTAPSTSTSAKPAPTKAAS